MRQYARNLDPPLLPQLRNVRRRQLERQVQRGGDVP
jgi:hypothetical protein